ncbi:MAG TPA: hypothetical protein VFH99_03540 [Candidatus Saccharimonadales bacterium]|nr:hypothetical protein [Candidatus Saccharimonadales bacterium]
MRKFIIILATLITFSTPLMVAGGSAIAASVFQPCDVGGSAQNTDVCGDVRQQNNTDANPIIKIIKAAIEVLSFIIGAAAVIGIVVSGIRMMTAGGNSESVASARSGLIYSLIGIAVVVLAQVLVAFVLDNVK